jgi:selenocysteine lyase/cysteine desulfurase
VAELSRRELVARAGAGALAIALGRPELAEAEPDLRRWSAVRAQFALDPTRVHLASFLLAAHPRPVRDAIARHRRGLDRDAVTYLETKGSSATSAARATAARYLGVPADEIALTDSTTMGLGLLYTRLALEPGEEVVTTEHDFYATHEALRLSGARVRRIRLYEDPRRASVDEMVTRLRRGISDRTRVVALTWVHSSTGVKLPIRAIADALPEGVLVCVDGVHGFGCEAASVRDLRCDAFVSGCHKWLYGPRGTGVFWANRRARELLRPAIPSFDDGASYGAWLSGTTPSGIPDGARLTPGGFHSFEHRWALPEAFRFHESIGRKRVEGRVRSLARRLQAGLSEVKGVRLRTPSSGTVSAGLVCFEVAGHDPAAVVQQLATRRIVASVTPYAQRYVRLGPGIVNTPAEVDAAVRAISSL